MKPGSLKGVAGRVKGYTPQIIYHDRGVIVVNKPPGLVTQTSKTLKNGAHRDAYSIFLDEVKTQLNLHTRPLHVHRLDKATTGALVLGRSPTLAKDLCKQFAERSVDKSYLALVHWHRHEVSGATGQVHVHLCMEDGRIDIARSMDDAGKLSVTSWEVAATSTILPLALLRLDLHTGLKHQLRVVLARYFQAPILGDSLYANPLPRDNTQGKIHGIPSDRLFLHSSSISIWASPPNILIAPRKHSRYISSSVTRPQAEDAA
ncbi:pseudouridine synthase [Punctularia strigosozonata HHB-11173 SS5]|uniref:pseudouridine synthase n=1 Tax=Punctularia strigosozonata (strain HHB-11173) TaxID=741275 RepID=UPI0004417258|nr:pseudouridine synthase [Punctularia strigosozonata HHB-11173 SS5]EIN05757.1 pseudouridine synthase [Punctularia strigosozonata HHB-11173 SS5]